MATLAEVYATRGDIKLIESVQINCPAWPSFYLVRAYHDMNLYVPEEGRFVLHQAAAIAVTKPTRDNRANQTVQFVIDNTTEVVRKHIREAYKAGEKVEIQIRSCLETDLSAPASHTLTADVKSAEIVGTEARLEAGFFSIYDTNFNRITYNSKTAKALKYVSGS